MKGRLSLISAAVTMALAGTTADAAHRPIAISVPPNHPDSGNYPAPAPKGGSAVPYDTAAGEFDRRDRPKKGDSAHPAFDSQDADDFVVSDADGSGGIRLVVGLAESNGDLDQCGTATSLSATVGDQINFCYTVTNDSSTPLSFQTLTSTDVTGNLFTNQQITIPSGASFQYNRIVTAGATESPVATWTATDVLPGYLPSAGSAPFVDISASGTALDLDDDGSANTTMPFSFNFYGVTSNQLCISNNGFVEFATSNTCSFIYFNSSLPTADFESPTILPFWDDLYTGGNVYTATVGTEPNRQYVVEYDNKDTIDSQGADPGFTFETILNEADNTIDFVYQNVTGIGSGGHDGGRSATVGLQFDPTLANGYSRNTPVLSNGQVIHWMATSQVSFSASAQVTLNVGVPVAAITPVALYASAGAGSSVSTTLTIGNTGNRDLNWNLDEAPGSNIPAVPAFVVPFHSPEQASHRPSPRAKLRRAGKTHASLPFGTGGVPTYAATFTSSGPQYVNFDANAPQTLNTIASMSDYYYAGTFANNDFSQEYIVASSSGDLDSIDTTTGATQTIGNTGLPGNSITGIRWDSSSGESYAMAFDSSSTSSCLYTLDLGSGATQLIGCQSGLLIIDIAIDPSGNMYGVDVINDALVGIDKITGAAVMIGSIGFNANYAEGMDFDPATGILYFAGEDADFFTASMYTIDLTTGQATIISPIGPNGSETAAMAIAVAGPPCSAPGDIPWLSEDPTSGTTTANASDPVTVTLDATSLSEGTYSANVCVHTNDATQSRVAVPVTFTVGDTIFQDGFDGTP